MFPTSCEVTIAHRSKAALLEHPHLRVEAGMMKSKYSSDISREQDWRYRSTLSIEINYLGTNQEAYQQLQSKHKRENDSRSQPLGEVPSYGKKGQIEFKHKLKHGLFRGDLHEMNSAFPEGHNVKRKDSCGLEV